MQVTHNVKCTKEDTKVCVKRSLHSKLLKLPCEKRKCWRWAFGDVS